MKKILTTGLLMISVIALSGCQDSVDLKADTDGSNQTTSSVSASNTSTTGQTTNHAPTIIISTPAGVSVVNVASVATETNSTSSTDTTTTEAVTPTETSTGNGSTTTPATETNTDNETTPATDTSTDNGATTTPDTNTETTADPVVETSPDTDGSTTITESTATSCDAFANDIEPFVRVQLHYGLLSDAPYLANEASGLDLFTVISDANMMATTLSLNSTAGLIAGQLITYVGTNGRNYVAEIGEVRTDEVTIVSWMGLESAVAAGSQISSFYRDATHPNESGSRALADYGLGSAYPITADQTHVLLGDSWFTANEDSGVYEFEEQLKAQLQGSTIVNEGVGGDTLCDLINRFDIDVAPNNPQYVWVNSSVNDYYNNVSTADFKTRMQYLISKIQAIGAQAIVFDSAPSTENASEGSDTRRDLSDGYAGAVLDLLNESQL